MGAKTSVVSNPVLGTILQDVNTLVAGVLHGGDGVPTSMDAVTTQFHHVLHKAQQFSMHHTPLTDHDTQLFQAARSDLARVLARLEQVSARPKLSPSQVAALLPTPARKLVQALDGPATLQLDDDLYRTIHGFATCLAFVVMLPTSATHQANLQAAIPGARAAAARQRHWAGAIDPAIAFAYSILEITRAPPVPTTTPVVGGASAAPRRPSAPPPPPPPPRIAPGLYQDRPVRQAGDLEVVLGSKPLVVVSEVPQSLAAKFHNDFWTAMSRAPAILSYRDFAVQYCRVVAANPAWRLARSAYAKLMFGLEVTTPQEDETLARYMYTRYFCSHDNHARSDDFLPLQFSDVRMPGMPARGILVRRFVAHQDSRVLFIRPGVAPVLAADPLARSVMEAVNVTSLTLPSGAMATDARARRSCGDLDAWVPFTDGGGAGGGDGGGGTKTTAAAKIAVPVPVPVAAS
jgi:hypothetical protein